MTVKRALALAYGVGSYAVFLGVFLYAIGFLANAWTPTTIDGAQRLGTWAALGIDLALLGLFAVQHSVMARPSFKRWWTRLVPQPVKRSTYVLVSSLVLALLFWQWQPVGGTVWELTAAWSRTAVIALYAAGWATVLIATCLIDHFDLFGLRQTLLYARGRPYTHLAFRTPGPYRIVRHPLYVGWLMVFWAAPTMSVSRLVFALATTAYILIAIRLEERNLLDVHPAYRTYREQVPMLVPRLRRPRRTDAARS